jgi:excisionase family DNA binding protein
MAETDLADWLPIDRAAAAIGCSTRTIERLGKAKQLEQRLRRQEGTPPVAVYNPDDVARIASERRREAVPFVLPAVQASANGNGHREPGHAVSTRLTQAADADLIRQFLTLAVQAFQSPPSSPVAESVAATLYLTIKEAAVVSGLPPIDLRRAIESGELKARKTGRGGWRIKRTDLEAL